MPGLDLLGADAPQEDQDAFVRRQVTRRPGRGHLDGGRAVVVAGGRPRTDAVAPGPVLTCLGPAHDLVPLMSRVAGEQAHPSRLTVEADVAERPPVAWGFEKSWRWEWMLTTTRPAETGHLRSVTVLPFTGSSAAR